MEIMKIDVLDGNGLIPVAVCDMIQAARLEKFIRDAWISLSDDTTKHKFNIKPRLPDPVILRRVMPGDYRYGDIYGYTASQMLSFANDRVNHALQKVGANDTANLKG